MADVASRHLCQRDSIKPWDMYIPHRMLFLHPESWFLFQWIEWDNMEGGGIGFLLKFHLEKVHFDREIQSVGY